MNKILSAVCVMLLCSVVYGKEQRDTSQDEEVMSVFPAAETWFLPTGYQVKATIQNAIFSFNLNTPVVAIVDEPAVCPKNGNVIFPKKTRLIGTADILKSDDRINVRFMVAVLPNGKEFEMGGIALAPDGSAGIKGIIKEYKDVRMMASAVSGALSGVGTVMAATMGGQSIAAGAIGGALQQGSQQAQEITGTKVDVSISAAPFQKTLIFLSRRFAMDDKPKQSDEPVKSKLDEKNKKKDWKEE